MTETTSLPADVTSGGVAVAEAPQAAADAHDHGPTMPAAAGTTIITITTGITTMPQS